MSKQKRVLNIRAVLIALFAVLAIAAAAGLTYSWFTASVYSGGRSAQVGRLKVDATFAEGEETAIYEPGLEMAMQGEMKNAGSIPSFVRVSVSPTVIKRSDANGNPVTPGAPIENDPNITSEFDPNLLGYRIEGTDGADSYFWYKDGSGNYYVLMDGKANPEVALNVNFDGSGMGNDYQGAEILLGSDWKATQALPAAIQDVLGVDFNELEFIGNDLGARGRSAGYSATQAEAMAKAILERYA